MSTESRLITCGQILEREFRLARRLPIESRVSVEWTEDEEIIITSDGELWVMQIGSDDDGFRFTGPNGERLRIPYPADYLDYLLAE